MSRMLQNFLFVLSIILLWQNVQANDSQKPTPTTAIVSAPQQNSVPNTNQSTEPNQDKTLQFTSLAPETTTRSSTKASYKETEKKEIEPSNRNSIAEYLTVAATVVIAIFNGLLWCSTRKLWIESRRSSVIATKAAQSSRKSANIAEKHMTVSERAFISATGISAYYFPQSDGSYNWHLRPQWVNSGSTPTRSLLTYVDYKISDTEIVPDFKSINPAAPAPGRGHLAPRSGMQGGDIPRIPEMLTPELIEEIRDGKTKFLYIWGWVRYHDVFDGTPEHITRFCWKVIPIGYPKTYSPNPSNVTQTLRFDYIQLKDGNCADNECEE